jgi:hypothetical protein
MTPSSYATATKLLLSETLTECICTFLGFSFSSKLGLPTVLIIANHPTLPPVAINVESGANETAYISSPCTSK